MNRSLRVLLEDNPSSIRKGSGACPSGAGRRLSGGGGGPTCLRPMMIPRVRWGVQLFFLLLTLQIGWQFATFYHQALGGGAVTATRPGGVEAFLPIAALMSLKRLVLTGQWDPVHPAGLAFLVAVLLGALVARRAFCSWICPFGTLSRMLEWIRQHVLYLPQRWNLPRPLRLLALAPKWIILVLAVGLVAQMSVGNIELFLQMPYNRGVDGAMLRMVLELGATGLSVVAVLVLLSLAVRNGWCRFLCPYGALVGLAGLVSPFRIRRDASRCTQCRACTKACPSGIRVSDAGSVLSPECTACLSCLAACKTPGALAMETFAGTKVTRAWLVPAAAIAVLVVTYTLARVTGHWDTSLSVQELREAYFMGTQLR